MKVYVNVWRVCSIRFTTVEPNGFEEDLYSFTLEGTESEMVGQLVVKLVPVWDQHIVDLTGFHMTLYDWLHKLLQTFSEFMARWK